MLQVPFFSDTLYNNLLYKVSQKKLLSLKFKLAAFHHLIAPTLLEYPIRTKDAK